MIKFTSLRWGNAFSYGDSNTIQLDKDTLTQLVGKNGYGKSSIALVLEEGLFNSNSKKIKKGNILNRYSNSKSYYIEVDFEKDGTPYSVITNRTNTTSNVKLLRQGEDISSHTATGTYTQLENILGFDAKTFGQIVYQSSVSSLEFLTATDTARKTFLIELLNLGKYTKALDVFKKISSELTKKVDTVQTKLGVLNGWLAKYAKEDLNLWDIVEEPTSLTEEPEQIVLLNQKLTNIDSTNKKITQNNTYKSMLDSIDISTPYNKPDYPLLGDWAVEVANIKQALKVGADLSKKEHTKTIKCPTCSQDMDNSVMFSRILSFEDKKAALEARLKELNSLIVKANEDTSLYSGYSKCIEEWEKYHSLFDSSMQSTLLDKDTLASEIRKLKLLVIDNSEKIIAARKVNLAASEHNSKVAVITEQLLDTRKELEVLEQDLLSLTKELSIIQVLVKAFSTTGLVAYKIECLVKDLEELTNEYLTVLAEGRFQLSFRIASADKLNVVITDNGRDIDIIALSSGERARVNVATLLAIRKLMQALSNSRTNLLILDETVENLDAEGKEKLIEILLSENDLNTFLVSHGFTHPLIEKINVVKENNISRLE